METETIAQKAKRLLEPIPENLWIKFEYTDEIEKCCAFGHLNRLTSGYFNDFSYENCGYNPKENKLRDISSQFILQNLGFDKIDLADVNNGNRGAEVIYPQQTERGRVLALLNDMIAAGL